MKNINILNVMGDRVFLDKTKYDLKYIMNIEIDNKSVSDILEEIKDRWSNLNSIEKQTISQSMVGKYYSPKFQSIMDFK